MDGEGPTLYARFCKYRLVQDGCWPWMGSRKPNGYGEITNPRGDRLAHRWAWRFANGPIPVGMFIGHSCDSKWCVNPAHLYLCTPAENARDAAAHRLYPTGEAHHARAHPERLARGRHHGNARLTERQVRAIRQLAARGMYQRDIAARLGVSQGTIGFVLRGETWRHVT